MKKVVLSLSALSPEGELLLPGTRVEITKELLEIRQSRELIIIALDNSKIGSFEGGVPVKKLQDIPKKQRHKYVIITDKKVSSSQLDSLEDFHKDLGIRYVIAK
ncbi:hypothetical protein HYR54_15395 [Candidatus Acetothermia bacterium]|nr:hypothetical protein [Candidatus Acetothermia bacterium]